MLEVSVKSLVPAMLLIASTALGCSTAHGVDSSAAHALVSGGATLLDVRTDGEWEAGHLPAALHVPVQLLDGHMSEVPRDHPVVVYCASGVRSARATEMLTAAGYDARDLGAMSNW